MCIYLYGTTPYTSGQYKKMTQQGEEKKKEQKIVVKSSIHFDSTLNGKKKLFWFKRRKRIKIRSKN